MENFRQLQMSVRGMEITVLVSKKGKITIRKHRQEGQVQEIKLIQDGRTQAIWRKVHPIPYDDHFFENVWKGYRINKNIM